VFDDTAVRQQMEEQFRLILEQGNRSALSSIPTLSPMPTLTPMSSVAVNGEFEEDQESGHSGQYRSNNRARKRPSTVAGPSHASNQSNVTVNPSPTSSHVSQFSQKRQKNSGDGFQSPSSICADNYFKAYASWETDREMNVDELKNLKKAFEDCLEFNGIKYDGISQFGRQKGIANGGKGITRIAFIHFTDMEQYIKLVNLGKISCNGVIFSVEACK